MQIKHSTHHRWHKPITDNPLEQYNRSNQKRLQSSLKKLAEVEVESVIEPLTDEFLDWFQPFYEAHMQTLPHAAVHDLREKTEPRENVEGFYSLTLYEAGEKLGGIIFSLRKDNMFAIMFRALDHNWHQVKLQANPSLLTDYQLAEFAGKQGKEIFSHGLDRNPYGVNAAIGLATFKLAVGCTPKIPKNPEFITTETDTLTEDALVMLPPQEGEVITEATLVCTHESEPKYAQLRAYPDRLNITVLYRD